MMTLRWMYPAHHGATEIAAGKVGNTRRIFNIRTVNSE